MDKQEKQKMKYQCLNCLEYFNKPLVQLIEDIDFGDSRKLNVCPICEDERIREYSNESR